MKIVFWNVNRLSTSDSRARSRAERVLSVISEQGAEIVGLSEISGYGVARVESFAQDHGYQSLIRKVDGKECGTALLIDESIEVGERMAWEEPDSEVTAAVVTLRGNSPFTIASVYNGISGVSEVLTDLQRFAERHSGGRILAGGDFNIARALDQSKKGAWRKFGSPSIDAIQAQLGWIDVLPYPGRTEVPTFGSANGFKGMPRQLDRVFSGGDCATDGVRVEVAQVADLETGVTAHGVRVSQLSDHAMLKVHVNGANKSSAPSL